MLVSVIAQNWSMLTVGQKLAYLRAMQVPTPSISQVAAETRMSRQTVAAAESDEAAPSTVDHLCRYYGVTVDALHEANPPMIRTLDSTRSAREKSDASSSIHDDTPSTPSHDGTNMQPPSSGDE